MANILTYEGLKALEAELEELTVNKRKEISQKIKEAREQGDLSENAEYDAAKEEQRIIEGRIEELHAILKDAEVVDEDDVRSGKVNVGSKVTILDVELDETVEYNIVGSTEANILNNLISNESPLGRAIMGRKKGETVEVETPGGMVKYKIVKIEKPKK
ncbi:MAG: transcription elongation factor GreA [Lachnospiraceae bacterium]|nr:transcription elongation factor GreA [Lachnospiraceae bacterium]